MNREKELIYIDKWDNKNFELQLEKRKLNIIKKNKPIYSKYGDAPIYLDYFYNGES